MRAATRGRRRPPGLRFQYELRAVSSAGRAPALHAGGVGGCHESTRLRGRRRPPPVFGFNTGLGRLAQLVERLLYTQVAAGSSPCTAHRSKPPHGPVGRSDLTRGIICGSRLASSPGTPPLSKLSRRWGLLSERPPHPGETPLYPELTLGRRRPGGATPQLPSIDDEIAVSDGDPVVRPPPSDSVVARGAKLRPRAFGPRFASRSRSR